jgi:two-component system, NtrC family, sensor kinase
MKLVRRLTLHLLLAVGFVFAVDTLLGIRSHLDLFYEDLRHDERDLGSALALAVERVWLLQGVAAAQELVAAMDESVPNVEVRLVYVDAGPDDPFAPHAPRPALRAVRRERLLTDVRLEGEPEARLVTYVPLNVPSERIAALEISELLAHELPYLRDRSRRSLETAAVMLLASGLVAWVVGVRLVGEPVRALVDKARRIGRRDFSSPLVLPRGDELSQLANEMNSMAAALATALQKVEDESAARVQAIEQLRHADRLSTVGKLASGLAHELGTPLNVVAGRAKMITSGELDSREEELDSARIIAEQAERMTQIVRQLLDFARRRPADKRETDLEALARQTATLLQPLAKKRGVSIVCDAPAQPIRAAVDVAQIQQALTNLVLNAIQASAPHRNVTVSLCVRDQAEHPPPGITARGPFAVLEVRDEGRGIAAEHLPEVFDPFFTTKAVGEGTGLGLSVAHGIVNEHGGWVDVESEPGHGSRFRIWLPQEAA